MTVATLDDLAITEHLERIVSEPDAAKQKTLIRSEESFNLWQSILRGAGVITGCRRCEDVCPVGADYEAMLKDALEDIPEHTAAKQARLDAMVEAERAGDRPASYTAQCRWIGDISVAPKA